MVYRRVACPGERELTPQLGEPGQIFFTTSERLRWPRCESGSWSLWSLNTTTRQMWHGLPHWTCGCSCKLKVENTIFALTTNSCAFELRKAELKDIVQVMLRRGVTLTGGAVLRRLHHLWAQEDTPAVHQLQRSAPRWWESLQLPDDVFDAVDLAYGHREPFMPHQVVEIDPTGYNVSDASLVYLPCKLLWT